MNQTSDIQYTVIYIQGVSEKTGISVFDYLKSTIIVQKLHVWEVLEWF